MSAYIWAWRAAEGADSSVNFRKPNQKNEPALRSHLQDWKLAFNYYARLLQILNDQKVIAEMQ